MNIIKRFIVNFFYSPFTPKFARKHKLVKYTMLVLNIWAFVTIVGSRITKKKNIEHNQETCECGTCEGARLMEYLQTNREYHQALFSLMDK